jgi:signal transduction histidine kinase
MTSAGPGHSVEPMKTTDAVTRQAPQGWLGLVPPGWPSDVAVALVVGLVQLIGTAFSADGQPERAPLDAVALALLAAGPVALVARHRRPDAVMVFVTAVLLLYLLLEYPYGPAPLSFVVAVFTVVTEGHRLVAWLSAGALYAGHFGLGYLLGRPPPLTLAVMVGVAAWMLVLLIAAEVARIRRERMLEAARTRAEEARRRATEERLRIARELHDVLAHNISLISVQAGVALHLIDEQPGQSRTALTAIKQASNDALRELRSVLDALRQVDDGEPPRAPAPGLARLEDLVTGAKAARLSVRTRVEGTPRPLPVGVDLAAYRIVQEALTNVTRHAGPATVTVRVAYGEQDLEVQVDDDGAGVTAGRTSGGGNGIPGMHERAAALGGELEAGPRPEGGFRVLARLPLEGSGRRHPATPEEVPR